MKILKLLTVFSLYLYQKRYFKLIQLLNKCIFLTKRFIILPCSLSIPRILRNIIKSDHFLCRLLEKRTL